MRSGRHVPSVSMTATRPSAPPFSLGSWAITAMVCESWVLPQPAPMSVKSQPQTAESVLTELSIDLADAAGLKPFVEDRIPLSAASGDAETALSDMCEVATGHESGAIGLLRVSFVFKRGQGIRTKLFFTASLTFSTLISEKPRILRRCLLC